MPLYVASLNSGSNGNCYYVGNDEEAVLIDGGISCRETERRMKRLELSMKKVKAIFVSHEHSDHIDGITSLSKRYRLPVYVTAATRGTGRLTIREDLALPFSTGEEIKIGNLTVTAFAKYHDASDPHSFIVAGDDTTIGVFTDIGRTCDRLIRHFVQCHAAFLESNYDEEMLEFGRYPLMLKNRIRGGHGHLSNTEALRLFSEHRPAFMSHLFLSHLSQHNNSPSLVEQIFRRIAGKTEIVIASRYRETAVYKIDNLFYDLPTRALVKAPVKKVEQLSLFN